MLKAPTKKTKGVIIRMGISCSFSKLSAHIPIIKPNKANVTEVNIKNIIINGCSI